MVVISEQGRKISETEVTELERELGATLPDSYRRFLIEYNGGRPSPDIIDIVGLPGSPTDVQSFFSIGDEIESCDLIWNLRLIDGRRTGFLPIACDSGGSRFCLRSAEGKKFEVAYLDMMNGLSLGAQYDVAPSFEAFLAKLRL